jgi:hypothetical protein
MTGQNWQTYKKLTKIANWNTKIGKRNAKESKYLPMNNLYGVIYSFIFV